MEKNEIASLPLGKKSGAGELVLFKDRIAVFGKKMRLSGLFSNNTREEKYYEIGLRDVVGVAYCVDFFIFNPKIEIRLTPKAYAQIIQEAKKKHSLTGHLIAAENKENKLEYSCNIVSADIARNFVEKILSIQKLG